MNNRHPVLQIAGNFQLLRRVAGQKLLQGIHIPALFAAGGEQGPIPPAPQGKQRQPGARGKLVDQCGQGRLLAVPDHVLQLHQRISQGKIIPAADEIPLPVGLLRLDLRQQRMLFRSVDNIAVPALGFREVQAVIRHEEQITVVRRGIRVYRCSDGHGGAGQGGNDDTLDAAQVSAQFSLVFYMIKENQELVAADPPDDAAVLDFGHNNPGHLAQELISPLMPVIVIDMLEIIHIQNRQGGPFRVQTVNPVLRHAGDRLFGHDPGQGIIGDLLFFRAAGAEGMNHADNAFPVIHVVRGNPSELDGTDPAVIIEKIAGHVDPEPGSPSPEVADDGFQHGNGAFGTAGGKHFPEFFQRHGTALESALLRVIKRDGIRRGNIFKEQILIKGKHGVIGVENVPGPMVILHQLIQPAQGNTDHGGVLFPGNIREDLCQKGCFRHAPEKRQEKAGILFLQAPGKLPAAFLRQEGFKRNKHIVLCQPPGFRVG